VPSSLYIHLPFCKTKCPYCDFASFTDRNTDQYKSYFQALENEIHLRCQNFSKKQILKTIFFGGGTPSIHEASELEPIFETLAQYFIFDSDTEITLEANPGTVNKRKLENFKMIGINRLSLGVQTFSDELISYLARGHSVAEAKEIIELVKEIGFNSWSIDLIYGLPHQSMDQWKASIDEALSFNPPHVSSYALSIEANTPFGEIYKNSEHKDLPQEESVVKMYMYLNKILEQNNIERYEISNWAKRGHEARHNMCYWLANEYYAFGLSAHGFIDKKRYANTRDLHSYLMKFSNSLNVNQSTDEFTVLEDEIIEIVDIDKSLEEEIFLKLRLKEGLLISEKLEEKINTMKLKSFIDQGFIEDKKGRIILTDDALMISNKIIFELIK
jgi:oxygen-independent coproporphyrinogen III oxidase